MFSVDIRQQQPHVTEILSAAIQTNRLHHCLMFEYGHPLEQYWLALELAKILNCQQTQEYVPCGTCNSCTWIRKNIHPAFITVSPVDLVVTDATKALDLWSLKERRQSKSDPSIINVRQARYIKKMLSVTSNYYKVIVFTNASDQKSNEVTYKAFWDHYSCYFFPPKVLDDLDNNRFSWMPISLTKDVMPEEMANTLLKSFEEPPPNVLFVFMTRDHSDILNTIVSRCQILPLLCTVKDTLTGQDEFFQFFDTMDMRTEIDALKAAWQFIEFSKESTIPLEDLLSVFQRHCYQYLIQNVENKRVVRAMQDFMLEIDNAKDALHSYVNAKAIIEDLFLKYVQTARTKILV